VNRAALALLVSMLPAFAPAPLPRRQAASPADEFSLSHFQGYWEFTRFDETSQVKGARVEGDRWTYVNRDGTDNAVYTLVVGKGRGPLPIDWHTSKDQPPYFLGLVQRDGDTVHVIYRVGVRAQDRPAAIAGAKGWLVMTLRRGRP
jgi:hypothetical protein